MNVDMILSEKGGSVVTISESRTLEQAAGVLDKHGIGALVVIDSTDHPIAILSERDIVREVALNGSAALSRPVANVMTQAFATAERQDSMSTIMRRMTDRRVRHLPVMDGSELIGIISIGDVVKAKIADVEAEASAIREYISS
jgi:CBS domain-containing protein